jgi:hypothetical protein
VRAACLLLLLTGTGPGLSDALAGKAASDLDWTIGRWEGVRRDAQDGREAPMTLRVEPILGGEGQIQQPEVTPGGGIYRGFAVQVFDRETDRWRRHYTIEGRGRFSNLQGEVEGGRSVWRVTSAERTR